MPSDKTTDKAAVERARNYKYLPQWDPGHKLILLFIHNPLPSKHDTLSQYWAKAGKRLTSLISPILGVVLYPQSISPKLHFVSPGFLCMTCDVHTRCIGTM